MRFLSKQMYVVLFLALFCAVPFHANAAMVGQGDVELDFSGDIANTDITLVFYDGLVAPPDYLYVEIQRLYASFDTNLTASISITPLSNPEIFGTLTDGDNDQITHIFNDNSGGYLASGLSEIAFFSGVTLNNIDFSGYTLSEVVFSFVGDADTQKILATITAYGDPVPVPSAFLLFAAGLLGLAGIKRKSSRA